MTGVDCIWLNPIHPSPGRDDRYDITDYRDAGGDLGEVRVGPDGCRWLRFSQSV